MKLHILMCIMPNGQPATSAMVFTNSTEALRNFLSYAGSNLHVELHECETKQRCVQLSSIGDLDEDSPNQTTVQ